MSCAALSMPTPQDLNLVLTTEANESLAECLAQQLLEQRLAACVSLMPLRSHYRWRGAIECAEEVQLLIKTCPERLQDLLSTLEILHSYDTPEILHWSAQAGSGYSAWATAALSSDADPSVP